MYPLFHRKLILRLLLILALITPSAGSRAQKINSPEYYLDLTHFSKVFGRSKPYRIYLPRDYNASTTRYPVIYFFHGWGGRHFKDDNAKLEYEKLKTLVDQNNVIMVMWDGNIEENEPRPYNVGDHENVRFTIQMKDYFPELIAHIDSSYRTLTDRGHRGIIGFSMGGFMSLFLSGKFPDMVCAAVSIMGSPEFFVGTPDNHTLYPVRYTFTNLSDVHVRMHTSPTDILFYLNEEVYKGALWQGKNISYEQFPGGHMVDQPGETFVFAEAIRFVAESFNKANKAPVRWSHYDLDPHFKIWDYLVESNKKSPGFIFLKNVDKSGFGLRTFKWLPHGPALPCGMVKVTTAPIYEPDKTYQLATLALGGKSAGITQVKTDAQGRLTVAMDPVGSEVGIFSENDEQVWVGLDYRVNQNSRFLRVDLHNQLTLRLFNRGGNKNASRPVRVSVRTSDPQVKIKDTVLTVNAASGERILTLPPFDINCFKIPPQHADPADVRLVVTIQSGNNISKDEVSVPVYFDAPAFTNVKIDDGVAVRDHAFGKGNADGKANAGEQLLLYEGEHRLRLYTEDPYVLNDKEEWADEMIPARWPDGFTQLSVIQIAPDCPEGHEVEVLACYETKTFNPIERRLTWGKIKFPVKR